MLDVTNTHARRTDAKGARRRRKGEENPKERLPLSRSERAARRIAKKEAEEKTELAKGERPRARRKPKKTGKKRLVGKKETKDDKKEVSESDTEDKPENEVREAAALAAKDPNPQEKGLRIGFWGLMEEENKEAAADKKDQFNPVLLPTSISSRLKDHQVEGVRFMWASCFGSGEAKEAGKKSGLGCILAHTMGLGKTFQCVALSAAAITSKAAKHILIISPVNVVLNWAVEFEMWIPRKFRPELFQLASPPMAKKKKIWRGQKAVEWAQKGGVLIIGFECYRNMVQDPPTEQAQKALTQAADLVIIDEGHRLKNPKTGLHKAMSMIRTSRRIVLTGTPLQNCLMEFYHMVNYARPGTLGTKRRFKKRFVEPIKEGQLSDSTPFAVKRMRERAFVLHNKLKDVVHRRGHADANVGNELPVRREVALFVELSNLQRRLYRAARREINRDGNLDKKQGLFKSYQMFSRIWNHPEMLLLNAERTEFKDDHDSTEEFDNNYPSVPVPKKESWFRAVMAGETDYCPRDINHSGKFCVAMELLETIIHTRDERVVVFSTSLDVLYLLEEHLQSRLGLKLGIGYYRIDGSTAPSKRQEDIDRFNDPDNHGAYVFLVSTRAGGIGINLTRANHVMLMDVSWNPSHDLQAIYRCLRLGQKSRSVHIYRLISSGTMEQRIYERQLLKQGLAARIVDETSVERLFESRKISDLYADPDQQKDERKKESKSVADDDGVMALMAQLSKATISGKNAEGKENTKLRKVYNPYTKDMANLNPESPLYHLLGESDEETASHDPVGEEEEGESETDSDDEMRAGAGRRLSGENINRGRIQKSAKKFKAWVVGFHEPAILLGHIPENVLTDKEQKQALQEFQNLVDRENMQTTYARSGPGVANYKHLNLWVRNIATWTPQTVGEWITQIGLQVYAQPFALSGISGRRLLRANDKLIKQIIPQAHVGHRAHILVWVARYIINGNATAKDDWDVEPRQTPNQEAIVLYKNKRTGKQQTDLPALLVHDLLQCGV